MYVCVCVYLSVYIYLSVYLSVCIYNWDGTLFFNRRTFVLFSDNWALIHAQQLALAEKLPLHICFCLVPQFLDAAYRQYAFMIRGLQEVAKVKTSVPS